MKLHREIAVDVIPHRTGSVWLGIENVSRWTRSFIDGVNDPTPVCCVIPPICHENFLEFG